MLDSSKWQKSIVMGTNPLGEPILTVSAKASFSLQHGFPAQICSNPPAFNEKEEFIGGDDPLKYPPKCEPDLVPYKAKTDLLIHGRAFSPEGRRARFFDLTVAVNDFRHQIRVTGNRQVEPTFTSIGFSEPELFEEMPMHYGLAYGGCDSITNPDHPLSYPRNPIGKGFVIEPSTKELIGMVLPNLENPSQLLTPSNLRIGRYDKWASAPEPRALGIAPKNSHPRNSLQNGPLGMWNAAPPRLCFPPLWGDESISLTYMDKLNPLFTFELPGIAPTAWIETNTRMLRKYMMLQTIEIFKEVNQMTMVWSAPFPVVNTQEQFSFGVI